MTDYVEYKTGYQEYVLGFCFDKSREHVLLLKKARPKWQEGKLNGVGGKIEVDESPKHAMIREFHEETGLFTENWEPTIAFYRPDLYKVRCFRAFDSYERLLGSVTQNEGRIEPLYLVPTDSISQRAWHSLPNIKWLVPLHAGEETFDTGDLIVSTPEE